MKRRQLKEDVRVLFSVEAFEFFSQWVRFGELRRCFLGIPPGGA